jgi:hypothetical protein
MSKFTQIRADILTALASSGLEIYPEDYQGDIVNESRFARYSIMMPNTSSSDYDRNTMVEGALMVRLFCEAGRDGVNAYADANTLDAALENKSFTNGTRFQTSTLSNVRQDAENASLVFMVYTMPFTQYE